MRHAKVVSLGVATIFVALGGPARADWPDDKPIEIVVGFAPGGGTDIIARLLAQKLGERWSQAIVVENKLGASGNIAAEAVARSAPDGYTLLMTFSSHASNAAVSKLPFDIICLCGVEMDRVGGFDDRALSKLLARSPFASDHGTTGSRKPSPVKPTSTSHEAR